MPFVLRKLGCCVPSRLDKAPRLVFILIQYLSNSTKRQILGRQCYLGIMAQFSFWSSKHNIPNIKMVVVGN